MGLGNEDRFHGVDHERVDEMLTVSGYWLDNSIC